MERQHLVAALAGCMNPDPRARAVPGQLHSLLQLSLDGSIDPSIQQSAAITFKNGVKGGWDPEEAGTYHISEEEKAAVRAAVPAGIISASSTIKKQLRESAKIIIYSDYPEKWPGLLSSLAEALVSQDQARIEGALNVLRLVARKYEFKDEEERTPLNEMIQTTFPLLLPLFQSLIANDSSSTELAELLKLVCKIFWSATYLAIPALLTAPDTAAAWMDCIRTLIARPAPLQEMPADPETRDSWPWWKAKKWALHIAYRMFSRYGTPDMCTEPADVRFAKIFRQDWALPLLHACLQELAGVAQGRYLAGRVANLVLQYVTQALAYANTWKALKPTLGELLPAVVFPMLCFTAEDEELWRDDPQEYIRKGYDIVEDLHSCKTAAMNFVLELCKARPKGSLDAIVQHMVGVLAEFRAAGDAAAPPDLARRADGACLAVGVLAEVLKQKERYRTALEPMLLQHVAPLFASRHGHLRAKAAWLAGCFADVPFSDGEGRGPTFGALLQRCIAALGDTELPVRIDAAVAVRAFLDVMEEGAMAEFRPLVPGLLSQFLALSQEIDNEDLTFSLETVVERFADDMAPYATGLTQHLVQQFCRIVSEEGEGDDDDEGALAAYGVLRTLSTILDSVSKVPDLYPQLEELVFPILDRFASTDGQDVFEEITQIITYLTYYGGPISERMWSLLPKLLACLDEWAVDYWEDVLMPLDNYVSRDPAAFLSAARPFNALALTNRSIERALTGDGFPTDQVACAARLMGVILQNCRGQVDVCVAPYVALILRRLATLEEDDDELRDALLLVAADLFYYDAGLTLRALAAGPPGGTVALFGALAAAIEATKTDGRMKNFGPRREKRQLVLGLASVLGAPDGAVPPEVGAGAPRLAATAVRVLLAIKAQEERREAQLQAAKVDEDYDHAKAAAIGGAASGPAEEEVSDEDEDQIRRGIHGWSDDDDDEEDDEDWWSDDDEASEIQSPIDAVDPFVFFGDVMGALAASNSARLAAVMSAMDSGTQQAIHSMSAYAAQVKLEQAAAAAAHQQA